MFRNHYHCPRCDISWSDTSDCTNDDRCPQCRTPYTPESSDDIANDDAAQAVSVELTAAGEQFVMPGFERAQPTTKGAQLDLWGGKAVLHVERRCLMDSGNGTFVYFDAEDAQEAVGEGEIVVRVRVEIIAMYANWDRPPT